jgi:protein subunit release factor B
MNAPENDEELLSQCEVETFRSRGPGGQNVNTRNTAVRLRHLPSGIVVSCQRERSQLRNRQLALQMLRRRLAALNAPKLPRIPTREPRGAHDRVVEEKRRRGLRKLLRRRPPTDE